MDAIESQLLSCQWLTGTKPTSIDAEQFAGMNNNIPDVDTHPNAYAWYSFVSKFSEKVRQSWPKAESTSSGFQVQALKTRQVGSNQIRQAVASSPIADKPE